MRPLWIFADRRLRGRSRGIERQRQDKRGAQAYPLGASGQVALELARGAGAGHLATDHGLARGGRSDRLDDCGMDPAR